MDYLSLKSFVKEGISWNSVNENFTHWLPIYLPGADFTEEKEVEIEG